MYKFWTHVLSFFRLIDENRQLSLTNIAVIIVLVKLALMKNIDLNSVSVLLTTLGAYNFKRYLGNSKKDSPIAAPGKEVSVLMDEINKIKLKMGFSKYE